MILDDAFRIRVIRSMLGLNSKSFAARLDVCAGTLTAWERGRTAPQGAKRQELYELCRENGIAFSPSGMPFPIADVMIFRPANQGE